MAIENAVLFVKLLDAVKNAKSLIAFIESPDKWVYELGDIELEAAKNSFLKVNSSDDKRGQIWSCIGHLESSYEAYKRVSTSQINQTTCNGIVNISRAETKAKFVLCLMAVCYCYLGEKTNCKNSLMQAEKPFEDYKIGKISLWMLSGAVNPFVAADVVSAFGRGLAGAFKKDAGLYDISEDGMEVFKKQIEDFWKN